MDKPRRGRPPKLDRLSLAVHRAAAHFDAYEWAALQAYRDAEELRTGRRPSIGSVLRALVRELAGMPVDAERTSLVTIAIHDPTRTQPPPPP
jgi:hypothetical protein